MTVTALPQSQRHREEPQATWRSRRDCFTALAMTVVGMAMGVVVADSVLDRSQVQAASTSCSIVVGMSSTSGTNCRNAQVNSQGLILGGGKVACP